MAAAFISRLEEKVQLLLKKMQFLQEDNQHLQETIALQQEQLREGQDHIKDLEHQFAMLKIASSSGSNGQESSEVRKELRSTINRYIHEIDHCISRLNE